MPGNINHILFCENPLAHNRVEPDFEPEYTASKQNGFEPLLFNYDEFLRKNYETAIKKVSKNKSKEKIIYRGWMLTPVQYSTIYEILLNKNYELLNTGKEYQNCHYLPDSLKYINGYTPVTIYEKTGNISALIERASIFSDRPVIIKDYVKSEKHNWDTACFVKNASNKNDLKEKINNFMELRGEYLNEGIVLREYVELNNVTTHSKSGMPLSEEYRLFFMYNRLLGMYDYWEEGAYTVQKPETASFEEIAKNIESNYFTMDIAKTKEGKFIIIELGDGQVAGLPKNTDVNEYYRRMNEIIRS
ncbi:hypothetical protein FACS1894110_20040 [Spirochaetia bacterium]|nr:hypothetical protein FACS1894110_20040 [Spirochaetia bacterium]